jgi:hypothetical protein
MGKIYADTSNQQVVDFKDLILQIDFYIVQNAAFGNHRAVSELVEQLDIIMDPYKDRNYKEDITEIMQDVKIQAQTPTEYRQAQVSMERERVREKQRALMRLAFRKRFLPSSPTGKQGGYEI